METSLLFCRMLCYSWSLWLPPCHRSSSGFGDHSIYWSLHSSPYLETHKNNCQKGGSKDDLLKTYYPRDLEYLRAQGERSLGDILLEVYGWASCWSPECSYRNCIPFTFFDLLNDLSYFLSPLSHGGSAPELWVLLEGNWFPQQYQVGTSSLLSFLPMREAPPASSNLCCVTLG